MRKPDWFLLIEQWRAKGMGVFGVTLPFIVGALARKAGERKLDSGHVRKVLDEMIGHPVEGYVIEVKLCVDIDAPVFSAASKARGVSYRMPFEWFFPHPSGVGESLVLDQNLQSLFGSDCKDANECYSRLLAHATRHVASGNYSRNWDELEGRYVYGSFSDKHLEYIRTTILLP